MLPNPARFVSIRYLDGNPIHEFDEDTFQSLEQLNEL